MVRVLQLLDHDPDFQTQRSAATLARDLGEGFAPEVHTIGRGGTHRDTLAAMAFLRRSRAQFNLIHTWSSRALTAAALAFPGAIAHTPPSPLRRSSVRYLAAVASHRDVHSIVPTTTMKRLLVQRGLPLDRTHVIRPGVDFSRVKRRRDPVLRKRLGFEDHDHVVLLPGESTRAANHELATWAGAILSELDPRQKILIWGRGDRTASLLHIAQNMNQAGAVRSAERELGRAVEFEELLPAADAVLVTSKETAPTLPISICMAAGLPIVSTVTYTSSELLEDRHTALMVPKRSAKLLARRVMDLREDSSLQWSIADMARTEAYEYFAQTRFVSQHRTIYSQLAEGAPAVSLPPEAAGAGLRFHGRA